MSSTPTVSVVMPLRNAEDTLEVAVTSVCEQTFTDWELIVVDDGSTDGSSALLNELTARDDRIYIEHTVARGVAPAMNRACELARGEWIARMDSDDWMHPERLAKQLQHAQHHPDLGVISCRVGFGGDGEGYGAHIDWLNTLVDPETIALRCFVESPVANPSVMFHRELVRKHGGCLDGDFPEDYEMWLRWLDAGVRFGKVDEELLIWNDCPTRMTRNDPRYAVERFYELKCKWLAKWLEREVRGRALWLWGAGRVTRRRFESLTNIHGYIDVDPNKVGGQRDGRPVRLHDDLPAKDQSFILVGVGKRGVREEIQALLEKHGWVEGCDYLLVA